MLDFSYGFFVEFSFYWFWFGFGMGFLAGMGCDGDSWVVLSWGFSICLLLLYWVTIIVGKERELEWGGELDQREKERVGAKYFALVRQRDWQVYTHSSQQEHHTLQLYVLATYHFFQ